MVDARAASNARWSASIRSRTQRQRATQDGALVVAQERIVAGPSREHAFGETAYEQVVEIGAEREADRPDEDPFAQPSDAFARRRSSSSSSVRRKTSRVGAGLDLVEPAEPVERRLDPPRRLLLEHRPLPASADSAPRKRPTRPWAHVALPDQDTGTRELVEVGGEVVHEGA